MNNDNNNYSIAERYRTVRKNLDDLGYKQSLSLDSLPLIELLLVDLAQTKETLKHFQSIAKDNLEACSQLQLVVDPYKCDNAKLVQECNQIHQELIEAKEENQKLSNDCKKRIRKLESELSNQQLSSSKNLQRIKQLELESSNKSKKILELLGKCCKPIVNNVNLATKKRSCYPLRRPILETESLPRTTSTSSTTFNSKSVEPCVIDFVSMADHKISCLSNEVTKLKEELFLNNEHIETLKSQLNTKEKEVSRLRKMLEGGRPCVSINKDHCCLRPDILNEHKQNSNSDDFLNLQKSKINLEQQLKEALNKQHDAMAQAMKLAERNEELENELKDVDRIALAVEADCNSTVKENNRRVCRLQEKLENLMTQVHVLESELTIQRREAQELRADLEASRLEKSNIQRVLESTLEEKKQMTDRINHLTIMESNLNCEIDHLKMENKSLKSKIHELERNNQILEQKVQSKSETQKNVKVNNNKLKEKEEKAEANARKKCIKKLIPASKSPEKSTVYQEKRNELRKNSISKECSCQKKAIDEVPQCNMDKRIHEKNVIIESLQNTIERIETERDHYKSEYNILKDQLKKDTEKDGIWSQICELRAQMSEKEHVVSKLLREKKELCQEKFNLESKLRSYQSQQRRSTSPCNYCRSNTSMSEQKNINTNNKIERLEREKDVAMADVARLIEERDALRERLKLATETHVSERRRLTESLGDAQSRLVQVEQKWRDLLLVQGSCRATMNGLDDQLDNLKEDLRRTKLELTEQRTQYYQLRTLQDQTDQALGDVQGQLTQCENELSCALDRNKNIERQQLQFDNQIKELKQEINTHRCKVSQLDREKDQLLMDLDEKTEKIAALEREINFKDQQANGMEQQLRELSCTKEICIDQAADMERQMRSMQLEMENLQRELSSVTCERENVIQQNRHIQDDLAAVSCEVRSMHKELEASKAESHDLKRQLQTYVCEVRRAEDLLSQKENERTEMLNHFRSLSLEASVLENNNHSLESEAAEIRGSLQAARDQITDLERQLSDKDCLIQGYEMQITELTQNVATLEIQAQQAVDERQRAEDDLRTTRDLCVTVEQQKECLSQRLNENTEIKTQYEVQIARYKSEQDIFQDQMKRDHMTIDRLEKILEESRKETMTSQTNSRELQCEVTRMKQKICELQNKLSTETSELRKYQTQAAEYSKQICELRRQVTNERFERARLQESSQSLVVTNHKSEYQNKKEANRPKCCQCNKADDPLKQQSHRCSKDHVSKSQGSHAMHYNCCSDEIKVCKIKTSPSSDGVCPTIDKKSCFCKIKKNHVNKIYCWNDKKNINDGFIISCEKNKNNEYKKLNIENLTRACVCKCSNNANDTNVNYLNCKCQQQIKSNVLQNISPCWIIQILNVVNKLLEERRKTRNEKCTNPRSTETKTKDETDTPTSKENVPNCSSEEKNIQSNKGASRCDQNNESRINTYCSTCTSSTQTQNGSIVNSNVSSNAHLLTILAKIQSYIQNINDYFQTIKPTPELNITKENQCYENRQESSMLPSNKYLDLESNLYEDVTLATEKLSAQNIIDFQDSDVVFSSTPRASDVNIKQNSNLILDFDSAPNNQQAKNKTNPKVNFELLKSDSESSQLDFDDITNKTEYKCLPKQCNNKISNQSRSSNSVFSKVNQTLNEAQTNIQSIEQKIECLRNEILMDMKEAEKEQLKHIHSTN